jgi:hypothetical protein
MRRADHLPRVVISSSACPVSAMVKSCKGGYDSLSGRSSKGEIKIITKHLFYRAFCIKQ